MPEAKLQPIYHCPTCNRGWGVNANITAPKYWQSTECSYRKK